MFYTFRIEREAPKNKGERDHVPYDFDYQHPHAEAQLDNDHFPDFEPRFSKIILTKRSRLVDLIKDGAIGGYGFLISPRLKGVLENFRLPPTRFYPVVVSHPHAEHDYYWMQNLPEDNLHWIDFGGSVFIDQGNSYDPDAGAEARFPDATAFRAAHESYTALYPIKMRNLVLNERYTNDPLDFFYFRQMLFGAAISVRLKNALEKERITGLEEFIPLPITKA